MKILGKTNKGVVADISMTELANLLGFYSEYADEMRTSAMQRRFDVGSEVDVSRLYRDAKKLDELRSQFRKFEHFFKETANFYVDVAKDFFDDNTEV